MHFLNLSLLLIIDSPFLQPKTCNKMKRFNTQSGGALLLYTEQQQKSNQINEIIKMKTEKKPCERKTKDEGGGKDDQKQIEYIE